MKTLPCDVCGEPIEGESFDDWFQSMHVHYTTAHADVMAAMAGSGWPDQTRRALIVERVKGIEPSFSAWEADVLPLNDTRKKMLGFLGLYS